MKVCAYFNKSYLGTFNEVESDLIAIALSRYCALNFGSDLERAFSSINKDDSADLTFVKYCYHCAVNFSAAFTSQQEVQNYTKQNFIDVIRKNDREFLGEFGREYELELRSLLKKQNHELSLKLEEFDEELNLTYEVICHPEYLRMAAEQLPFLQIELLAVDDSDTKSLKNLKRLRAIPELSKKLSQMIDEIMKSYC